MLNDQPSVSVIIPTYNRPDSLRLTLESLAKQDYENMDVIIVDDGSDHPISSSSLRGLPFPCHLLPSEHKGGTQAKNAGATAAGGDILMFLDDDIRIVPDYVSTLADAHKRYERAIIMGHLIQIPTTQETVFSKTTVYNRQDSSPLDGYSTIPFFACLGGFFTIKKRDFFELGMLEGVGDGWPNWEDVHFGYKAHTAGFLFLRTYKAVGWHHDFSLSTLQSARDRWYRASRVAPLLFSECPGLEQHMTMYTNKTLVAWGKEPFSISLRKTMYQIASKPRVLSIVERVIQVIEQYFPVRTVLTPLYRWVIGGHMVLGYKSGIHQFKREKA